MKTGQNQYSKGCWRSALMQLALLLFVARAQAQTLTGPTRPVTAPGVASVSADGGSFTPVYSGDGRHIAFVSQANNLVANDDTATFLDVFVRDLGSGTTRLTSVNSSGQSGGNGNSSYPVLSSNGQFVAFLSTATNLTGNNAKASPNVYVRDLVADATTLVSASPSGNAGEGGNCLGLDMTSDGRFIAFSSTQTNLATNRMSWVTNLFLRDRQAGGTELLTVAATNASVGAHGSSDSPSISADGRRIAFYSDASDLVLWSGTPPPLGQVYLRDRLASTNICLGTNAQSFITGLIRSFNAALSSDGSAAVFIATDTTASQTALV